ncbi:hypothetical protein GDO78_012945 [Eleutherodactylus coqui]|uniref:Uncharacterized protein n=1 Tax=Eleutherodactylus coqui TaxID=57060 RepID=A0A8J6EZ58_ELECQ|nr:hypothetical protein GDO78_012945 [Eleutherodactylus coqui]
MSASVEDLLAKIRAEALVRGVDWLRETMAEALEDKGAAADTEDAQPCAKRVRPLEHRSPSPVPRTRCRVSSPDRDPPGAATGQCPASEGLHPGRNLFRSDSDLNTVNEAHDEDLRTSTDAPLQRDADSGPSNAVAVTVSVVDDESNDDQNYTSPLADSQPDQELAAQLPDNGSSGRVPITAHANRTVKEPDAVRIERLLQSCSAAASLDQQHAPKPVSRSAPDNEITCVEDLLAKFQAEALVRGLDWLQDTVAEILEDEGAAADTDDAQPCDKKVRPLEHRSPSPVSRTRCRVSSPDKDPPGVATGQCPASEGLHPGRNLFSSVSDLLDVNNTDNNEDSRTSFDTTFTRSFQSDCDMKSFKNMSDCEDEESSTSSDSSFEWAATAPDNDITSVEDLLVKFRAEALVRGLDWLQDTVAEILEDEGAAADTDDAQPCDKRIRPLEHRSPSPVPRTQCRVSSPDRDPSGAATGQCPASEGLHPEKNPFSS